MLFQQFENVYIFYLKTRFGAVLTLLHDAEEIATPHLLQIGRGESFGLQAQRQFGEVGGRSTAGHTAVAIEVGAYAHSINTGHVDKVHEVRHAVGHGGRLGVGVEAQETVVKRYLRHTAGCGQGTQLVIGKVARMVAEGSR